VVTGSDVAVAVAVPGTNPTLAPESLRRSPKSADAEEEACAIASENTFALARRRLAIEWWCIVGV
jgi:hypothetical protein